MQNNLPERCRAKRWDILCAVQDVCDKNGIKLILLGDAALAAYRRGDFVTDEIAACIDVRDMRRFMKLFEAAETGLVTDSMCTNGDFPSFELRVYDPATLDFNINDFRKFRYNCLHVRILPVLHVPSSRFKSAYLNSIRTAYEISNAIRFGERESSESRMVKILQRREKRIGRAAAAKWVFDKLADGYAADSDKVIVSNIVYKKSMFAAGTPVEINRRSFLIPSGTKRYFQSVFDKNWKNVEIKLNEEDEQGFTDPAHSWEEYSKRIAGMDFDQYDKDLREYNELHRQFSEYHKNIREYRNILNRTDMRFKMWARYMPQKQEIKDLHSKGDYEALETLLHDYLEAMRLCEKRELGLCFDEEILGIALDVLRHNGEDEYAERLDSLVPAEHREVLHIMDYKGNIIA